MTGQSAKPTGNGVEYRVWAPRHEVAEVLIVDGCERPVRSVELTREQGGFFTGVDRLGKAGDLYKFRFGSHGALPDPASHFQPLGVHGPGEVIDHGAFRWPESENKFRRPELGELVIYECHVGTFTREGTFAAAMEKLGHVKALGATAIELMPVADFAGRRNWGYDGVSLFAPSRCYGRPEELKELVAAAHATGLAVILDVVYNHFGPDGDYWESYLDEFFAKADANIWGKTINFGSKVVRDFFWGNVIHWLEHYHVDGFRLDATHAIVDSSEKHILTEIADAVRARGGFTIAEDERNWSKLVTPAPEGIGVDAVWADDFHHVVKVMLTGAKFAHFVSYEGTMTELVETIENGWLFRGQVYKQTGKKRGTESKDLETEKFIYCISNHDQVGNRPLGERLNQLVSAEAYAAASALLCVLPYTPMIFMGQEFAATTPFCFFTDHRGEIGKNVSKGRLNEFKHYGANFGEDVLARMPDPQNEKTFLDAKLNWGDLEREESRRCLELYQRFLKFRRERLTPELRARGRWKAEARGNVLAVEYESALVMADLKGGNGIEAPGKEWKAALWSGDDPEKPRTVVFEKAG
jgi:maltooligosyltrehalose trehalohydrolase